MLRDLAVDCELADEKGMMQGDVRMTVYWYDHSSPHFVRVSGHPDFSEYGRSEISVEEGVISEGWSLSYSRFKSGANDDAEWVAEQVSDYKIDKEIAEKIRMKSRSILAWRLQYDHVYFGVFVVESTRKTKANSALKTKIENSRQFDPIKRAVYRVRQSHIRRSLSPDR